MAETSDAVLPKWADEWTGGTCGCGALLCRPECYCGGHRDTCSRTGLASHLCVVMDRARTEVPKVTVHFSGGPWADVIHKTTHLTAPVFAVGHEIGDNYWLDTKSDPPTYLWIDPSPQPNPDLKSAVDLGGSP